MCTIHDRFRHHPLAPLLCIPLFASCAPSDQDDPGDLTAEVDDPGIHQWVEDLPDPVERDWAEIQAGDTLRVLLTFNSTSYFIYRGEPMGFEFQALRAFADEHDLALHPVVVRDRTELFRLLNEGEGDVVAARLAPTPEFREAVAFTSGLYETRPAVVQQAAPLDSTPIPEPVEELVDSATGGDPADGPKTEFRARLIRKAGQLGGDTVTLPRGSEYFRRVVELNDTVEGTIEIVELENVLNHETLIRRVAAGSVQLSVSPENVAELTDDYFTNILVQPAVGPKHPVAWAVRTNAPRLQQALNAWVEKERDDELSALYNTFFVDREKYRERVESEYLTSETGRLSEYDSLFAVHASELGWDWRLLASQAYQESKFDADARSWAGAQGLLQLMPATAREVGVSNPDDPAENVAGGVRYLRWLMDQWQGELPDTAGQLPFILASYNAGLGHVQDAQRIAAKNGDDPSSWDDVAYWLLQLSKRQHHTDPVVKYGYVRGLEPVTYVSLIGERFEHYKEFVTGHPLGDAVTSDRAEEVGDAGDGVGNGGATGDRPRSGPAGG